MSQFQSHTKDVFDFSHLISEIVKLFNDCHISENGNELSTFLSNEKLKEWMKETQMINPEIRPNMKAFISLDIHESDPFVKVFTFLENIQIKSNSSKELFFKFVLPYIVNYQI